MQINNHEVVLSIDELTEAVRRYIEHRHPRQAETVRRGQWELCIGPEGAILKKKVPNGA